MKRMKAAIFVEPGVLAPGLQCDKSIITPQRPFPYSHSIVPGGFEVTS